MKITIIAAVAANGIIGDDGSLPWDIPEDLQRFKERTTGHPVILGRTTYEGIADRIGGPLPDRTNVVLTTTGVEAQPSVVQVGSVEDALAVARKTGAQTVYVAGGASVYEQLLPKADRMLLTEIDEAFEGDVTFPKWDSDEWTEVSRDDRDGFAFVTYDRRGH